MLVFTVYRTPPSLKCEFELGVETEKLLPVKGSRGLGNHTVDSSVWIVFAGLVEKVNQATRLGVDVRLEIAGVDLDGKQGPGRQPEQFTRADALRVAIDRRPDVPIRDVKSVVDGGELEAALEDLRLVGARALDGAERESAVRLSARDEGPHYSTAKDGAGAPAILQKVGARPGLAVSLVAPGFRLGGLVTPDGNDVELLGGLLDALGQDGVRVPVIDIRPHVSLVVVADLVEEGLKGPVVDDAEDLRVRRHELVRVDCSLPYVSASMSRRQP